MQRDIKIREMIESDIPELLRLMEAIVVFEGDSDFNLTKNDLLQRGFSEKPEFGALVAETGNGKLAGIAVFYTIPFMHNLKPFLMLKWLYVEDSHRGKKIGYKLIKSLSNYALENGFSKFSWFVLDDNENAKKFYKSVGASTDKKWIRWTISPEKMIALAKSQY